ncbi:nitroreductase [Treponema sp.]|uniref:nitroreductase n=1 Tax=Treponema sp. TaxID=166 RepID=UPI0038908C9B
MSDILQTLKERRSCRKYKAELIGQESLDKILEAGTFAASGMGKQSAIIIAITNKEIRDKISELNARVMGRTGFDPFYGAPEIIVVLANKACPTYIYDGSLVTGNMMNEAESLDVATCWIHRAKEVFESDEGKELLKQWGIEGDYEGVANLAVGFADAPKNAPAPRKENYIYYVK